MYFNWNEFVTTADVLKTFKHINWCILKQLTYDVSKDKTILPLGFSASQPQKCAQR